MTGEPTVLGDRYVLGDLLGRGGMAQVYRARDTTLDRDVAVKVFHDDGSLPDGDLRRTAEVRLLASLSHPGLVTLFDAGREQDRSFTYLVMELVDGTTLSQLIARGRLPERQVSLLGEQLAEALGYVHQRGVVHRDIKPANVLVDPSGTVAKLTDFGVARLVNAGRLTAYGTTIGTPNYLSPEQATGAAVEPPSDIYSLGLVLFEALTGTPAYPGDGVEAAVVRLHRPVEFPPSVPANWRALLAEMTAHDPAARPDAPTVATRLRGMRHETAPTAVLAAPPRRPVNTLWVAAGLAVAVIVGGVLIGVFGGSNSSSGRPMPPPTSSAAAPSTSPSSTISSSTATQAARVSASSSPHRQTPPPQPSKPAPKPPAKRHHHHPPKKHKG